MYHFIATTTPALFRCAMRIGDYWIVHTPRALFGCINNCTLFNMVPKHQPAASHAVCSIHLVSSHLIKLIRKYGLRFEENVYKAWDCGIRVSSAQAPTLNFRILDKKSNSSGPPKWALIFHALSNYSLKPPGI